MFAKDISNNNKIQHVRTANTVCVSYLCYCVLPKKTILFSLRVEEIHLANSTARHLSNLELVSEINKITEQENPQISSDRSVSLDSRHMESDILRRCRHHLTTKNKRNQNGYTSHPQDFEFGNSSNSQLLDFFSA